MARVGPQRHGVGDTSTAPSNYLTTIVCHFSHYFAVCAGGRVSLYNKRADRKSQHTVVR